MSQVPPVDVTRSSQEPEISLGRELRRAREVRGISIEQIAQETKINERYLLALEADRLDLLPGQLYARNFVRAVARTIGADEEELLDYFNYQVRLTQDVVSSREDARTAQTARRGLVVAVVAVAAVVLIAALTMLVRDKAPASEVPAPQRPVRRGQAVTPTSPEAPGSAGVAGTSAGSPAGSPDGATTGTESAAAAPGTAARSVLAGGATPAAPVAVEATETAPVAGSSAVVAEEGPVPTLRISFVDASWVEIQREGEAEPVVGMKAKGATMSYPLDRPVTVTIFNSAGASLSVDGQAFRPLGSPQEKRTLTIDRKNFQQYVKK